MQDRLDPKSNAAFAVSDSSSYDVKDSDDESVPICNNNNYNKANDDLCLIECQKKRISSRY
jgi:hypothetical protein